MSSYRGHLFGGVLFFIPFAFALAYLFDFQRISVWEFSLQVAILFGITLMFALFPDVDIKSKGQMLFYRIFLALDLLLIFSDHLRESAYLGLFAMLPIISKHRGWTHSVWAVIFIPLPFLLLPMFYTQTRTLIGLPYYLAAVVGYLSHRFMDGMSFRRG